MTPLEIAFADFLTAMGMSDVQRALDTLRTSSVKDLQVQIEIGRGTAAAQRKGPMSTILEADLTLMRERGRTCSGAEIRALATWKLHEAAVLLEGARGRG